MDFDYDERMEEDQLNFSIAKENKVKKYCSLLSKRYIELGRKGGEGPFLDEYIRSPLAIYVMMN